MSVLDTFFQLAGTVPDRKDSSNQGGGFVNTVNDYSKYGNTNELEYQDSSMALMYAPATYTSNYTYIMLTDSLMNDSANNRTETPGTISTQQQQSASQAATESSGLDIPSLLIPIAAVAAVGGLGYAAIKAFGGKK